MQKKVKKEDAATEGLETQLNTLVALQHAESGIMRLESDLSAVDGRIGALNDQLTSFERQVEEGQDHLNALRKQYRDDEGEIKSIENRIAQNDVKLRSVKTNKEYQSMLKEIDELKRKASGIEDRMLDALDLIEAAEKQVSVYRADLEDEKTEIGKQQEEIRRTADAKRRELERLQEKRDRIMTSLPPAVKKLFERGKQLGRGIAVAGVVDAVCQVCRMNIPPQLYNELMRLDSMRFCPNCQRIIYPKTIIDAEGELDG